LHHEVGGDGEPAVTTEVSSRELARRLEQHTCAAIRLAAACVDYPEARAGLEKCAIFHLQKAAQIRAALDSAQRLATQAEEVRHLAVGGL